VLSLLIVGKVIHVAPTIRSKRDRLLIIQPYIPQYRAPFFRLLREVLADSNVELALAAPRVPLRDRSRGDDASDASIDFRLEEQRISLGSRALNFRRTGPVLASCQPGFVILEQAIRNAETWSLTLNKLGKDKPAVALWGQGRSYSTHQSPVESRLKQWLTQRASWFFAYTHAGAEHVIEQGFPRERATVVWNSTDTRQLHADLSAVNTSDMDRFRMERNLVPGRTGIFLGGLDGRKGIALLLDVARTVAQQIPGFRLLIGGDGELAGFVRDRQRSGEPLEYLGRLDGHEKALALSVSDLALIPEWVGLVAVDALVAGVPIVTTHHHSHSPEIEYLVEGETVVLAAHSESDMAREVIHLIGDSRRLMQMQHACIRASGPFSIENMVENFANGFHLWRATTISS